MGPEGDSALPEVLPETITDASADANGDPERAGSVSLRVVSEAETSLVTRLRNGDQEAFQTLVREHSAGLRRVARLHVSTQAVADEVVQDMWLAVIQGLAAFESRSSLKTWMYRILVNIARTRGLRERRTVPLSSMRRGAATAGGPPEPAVDPGRFRRSDPLFNGHWADAPTEFRNLPDERLVSRETTDVIQHAISNLPGNQQSVVWLRDVEGWTSNEVCESLSLTEANQRVLLHRARCTVRGVLEAYLTGAERLVSVS